MLQSQFSFHWDEGSCFGFFFPNTRSFCHVLFTFIFTVSRIAYETNTYLSEMQAQYWVQPFLAFLFLHTSSQYVKCLMISLYALYYAFLLAHFSFLLYPHEASWSSSLALWNSPCFFSGSFPVFIRYSIFSESSVNRARRCWMQTPSVSSWHIFSRGLKV